MHKICVPLLTGCSDPGDTDHRPSSSAVLRRCLDVGRIPETPRPSCYLTFPVHSGACAKWLGEEGHSHAKKCLQCSDSSRKEISLNQMIFAAPSNPNVPLLLLHTTQAHTAAILRGSAGRLKYRTDFSCLQPISASPQAPAAAPPAGTKPGPLSRCSQSFLLPCPRPAVPTGARHRATAPLPAWQQEEGGSRAAETQNHGRTGCESARQAGWEGRLC